MWEFKIQNASHNHPIGPQIRIISFLDTVQRPQSSNAYSNMPGSNWIPAGFSQQF